MIEMFMSNLWLITPTLWACLIVYAVWYSTKVKRYAPITQAEARQLWAIHYRNSKCGCKKWRKIEHHGQTVGFECGCGYKHMQQRPIVGNSPSATVRMQSPALNPIRPSNRRS